MMQANDPVGSGFVASLARPGGNITGNSSFSPELSGKRVELLRDVVPRLSRMSVFGTSRSPADARALKEMEIAATALGVKLQYSDVLSTKDLEPAFEAANNWKADGVLINISGGLRIQRKEIATLAIKSRLPAIYERREYVEDGGLVSYGVNLPELDRRAARQQSRSD
jgi:putative ABC transport system substrate-binding protein